MYKRDGGRGRGVGGANTPKRNTIIEPEIYVEKKGLFFDKLTTQKSKIN